MVRFLMKISILQLVRPQKSRKFLIEKETLIWKPCETLNENERKVN